MRLRSLFMLFGLFALATQLAACGAPQPAPTATLAPTPAVQEVSIQSGARFIIFSGENHASYVDIPYNPETVSVRGLIGGLQPGDKVSAKIVVAYLKDGRFEPENSFHESIPVDTNGGFEIILELDPVRRLAYHSVEIIISRDRIELTRSVKVNLVDVPDPGTIPPPTPAG